MTRTLANTVYLESPERGVDGRGVISGARAPVMTDGRIGDFWLDTVAKKLYGPKSAAAWPDNGLIKGDTGWTPVFAAVNDGSRRVQRVVDWVGGAGSKPATGKYVGSAGLVDAVGDALDIRGPEGPQALIDELDAASDALTDGSLISTAETGDDNKKRTAVEIFDLGSVLERLSVAEAQATTVRSVIKRLRTQYYAPDGSNPLTFAGGASYRRVNSQPTHSMKFRSTDRFNAEGDVDSGNGGWWEIAEPEIHIEMAGGKGDGSTSDQTAWAAAKSVGRPVRFLDGKTYLVTDASTNGVETRGKGKLVTTITGGQFQHNTYADDALFIGQEYLAAAYTRMMINQADAAGTLGVVLAGNSWVAGTGGDAGQDSATVMKRAFQDAGCANVAFTNVGVAGTMWEHLDVLGAGANPKRIGGNVKMLFITYVVNEGADSVDIGVHANNLDYMAATARAALTAVRADSDGAIDKLSICLVIPGATYDHPNGRDERWYEQVFALYRQLAREFSCAVFDGYRLFRDARRAAGFWMDNPYGDGRAIHTNALMNIRFWTTLVNCAFPRHNMLSFATNAHRNTGYLSETMLATDAPNTYPQGISQVRGLPDNDWPMDGQVTTFRNVDGPTLQFLNSYSASARRVMTRIAYSPFTTWSDWSGAANTLTLQNGWVDYDGSLQDPIYSRTADGLVCVQGTIKNGTITNGTVIANLPAGFRPAGDLLFNVSTYNTDTTALIRVKPNGDITGDGLIAALTSLSGIVFLAL